MDRYRYNLKTEALVIMVPVGLKPGSCRKRPAYVFLGSESKRWYIVVEGIGDMGPCSLDVFMTAASYKSVYNKAELFAEAMMLITPSSVKFLKGLVDENEPD